MPEAANLLRHTTSPYLLQHADNPVHWRPWGAEALAEAKRANKPILLSIGYAACHWCHVMAHESFEDPETAALMNRLFVNIKVDREERPDIDQIYMNALHAMGDQGGWPLTMFLDPDGAPFWGGTYFPPTPRWGKPSFRQVLEAVANAYASGDDMVRHNTAALRNALQRISGVRTGSAPGPADLDAAALALLRITDPVNGGLQGAPKFPNTPMFRFLWQDSFRTPRPEAREAVRLLLTRMSQGGIYDHLGGGYARYSTDAEWLVPHFEKMLYDNAQILELLAFACADKPDTLFAQRAEETVGWMIRDMTAGAACFAASEDADSEGEEGKFYVWSAPEVEALLGADAPAFKAAYDVRPEGNWEGKTILRRLTPLGEPEQERILARCRQKLFAARARRVRPGRDDKILADWNGLAIAALARAAAVFGRPDWLRRAGTAFDDVLARLGTPDGRVDHAWRLGRVAAAGLLEDQAAMARAALALHEATGAPERLEQAVGIAEAAVAHFADGEGGFYGSADDASDVPLARPRSAADNATPSGNGLIAEVFARLYHLTGEPTWRTRCQGVLAAFGGAREQWPTMPVLLGAAALLQSATTVVIAGDPGETVAAELANTALASPDPSTVVLRVAETGSLAPSHPAYGKSAGKAEASAFICRGQTCGLPVSDPRELAARLRQSYKVNYAP